MDLSEIIGEKTLDIVPMMNVRHPFDSEANGVLFALDDTTYIIFEDPSDGYRSYAGPVLSFKGSPCEIGAGSNYPQYLREPVLCRHVTKRGEFDGECDLLEVLSRNTGKAVFTIGTLNVDDYYPSFFCEWSPGGLTANGGVPA